MRFTSETENENSISFLDLKIRRDNNKLTTSVYRKPTFSGVFTNFGSFIPKSYNCNLPSTLLHRAFKLCSNRKLFHQESDKRLLLKITVIPKVLLTSVLKSFYVKGNSTETF